MKKGGAVEKEYWATAVAIVEWHGGAPVMAVDGTQPLKLHSTEAGADAAMGAALRAGVATVALFKLVGVFRAKAIEPERMTLAISAAPAHVRSGGDAD